MDRVDNVARNTENPKRVVPMAELPPVKAAIEIEHWTNGEGSEIERYSSRIVMRDDSYDYLDALRSSAGDVVLGWTLVGTEVQLLWGRDSYLYRYKILIDDVLDPLPALRVTYVAPPRRHNRRHEWRSNTKLPGKFTIVAEDNAEEEKPRQFSTITRNISYSAIRFFSRHRLKPETRVAVEWKLPDGSSFKGQIEILRTLPGITVYQGVEGHDVVGFWNPVLDGPLLQQWKTFCDRHRYD